MTRSGAASAALRARAWLPVLILAGLVGACGETSTGTERDGGSTASDGAAAEVLPGDAPVVAPDAGSTDAGVVAPDAGPADAPVVAPDAGSPDGAVVAPDGGAADGGGCAPLAVGDSILANADFEAWTGDAPDAWGGPESNIGTVEQVAPGATCSASAVRLVNASSSHRRFASAPMGLPAGHYSCTFQVKGQGEVRAGDYTGGNYGYGSYVTAGDTWKEVAYAFNAPNGDPDSFAFLFSVRNTVAPDHVIVDRVACLRDPAPCDSVICPDWAACNPADATCQPLAGRCASGSDCLEWESCDASNTCVLAPDRCYINGDCNLAGPTPVCDSTHHCVAGDPCAGVTCDAWKECRPADRACVLSAGRCVTTADCRSTLPACDVATHACVGADHAANIFPNGGFETWSVQTIPYEGDHLIPDSWYGLFDDLADATGASEIDPAALVQYTTAPHSGNLACQIVQPGVTVAQRWTSEDFDVPTGTYTCAYWIRGKGTFRHRTYSTAGWSPFIDFEAIDTDQWQQRTYTLSGNVRYFRLIFYVSQTDAARDHVQIDDVVCTRN